MRNPVALFQTLAKPHSICPQIQTYPLVVSFSEKRPLSHSPLAIMHFWDLRSSGLRACLQVVDVTCCIGALPVNTSPAMLQCHLIVVFCPKSCEGFNYLGGREGGCLERFETRRPHPPVLRPPASSKVCFLGCGALSSPWHLDVSSVPLTRGGVCFFIAEVSLASVKNQWTL